MLGTRDNTPRLPWWEGQARNTPQVCIFPICIALGHVWEWPIRASTFGTVQEKKSPVKLVSGKVNPSSFSSDRLLRKSQNHPCFVDCGRLSVFLCWMPHLSNTTNVIFPDNRQFSFSMWREEDP